MRLRDLVRDRVTWIYSAMVLAMFHRPLTTETFYFRDLYRLFYPKRIFFSSLLRSGELPLWDPLTNGGQPFLATPSNFAFHPSNVLYLLLPTIAAFNLVIVLHVLFCAIAAYWLARTLSLSVAASFVCGTAFGFCGYTLSCANLTPLLLALPWVPLTLGLLHRALRNDRSILPAAVAAAMPLYCAAAELTGMLFITIIVWAATMKTPYRARRKWFLVAVVIAGAIGLSLPQTLPATSVIAQSARSEGRTFASFSMHSVHPLRLPELVVPRFFGDLDSMVEEDRWGRKLEDGGYPYILSMYFGIPVLLLACAGFAMTQSGEIPRRSLGALALLGLLFSLGRHLPLLDLAYAHVPLIGTFRFPVKTQLLALLPLSLLAACGVDALSAPGRTRTLLRGTAIAFAVCLATGAVLLVVSEPFAIEFARVFSLTALAPHHRQLLSLSLFHAAIAAAALASVAVRPRLIAAVVALDLAIAGLAVNDFAPRHLFSQPPIATDVRAMTGEGRFYSAERPLVVRAPNKDMMWLARWQLATLADYTSTLFGIRAIYHLDYDELAPRRIERMGAVVSRMSWSMRKRLFDRSDIRAFLTPDEVSVSGIREMRRFEEGGLRLYANAALPAARFVSRVVVARGEGDAAMRMLGSDDASTLVVETPTRVESCGDAPVRILERSNNAVRYEVDAPCRGLVVFAEHPYEGWTATADGASTEILSADYVNTAVAVGPGKHIIERRYFPPRLLEGFLGMMITLAGLAFVQHYRPNERGD